MRHLAVNACVFAAPPRASRFVEIFCQRVCVPRFTDRDDRVIGRMSVVAYLAAPRPLPVNVLRLQGHSTCPPPSWHTGAS
jgi:hypothetical protein